MCPRLPMTCRTGVVSLLTQLLPPRPDMGALPPLHEAPADTQVGH